MRKARAFFFVCAGLACLTLAYHFGASQASAQVGVTMEGAAFRSYPDLEASFCVGRVLYWTQSSNGVNWLVPARVGAGGQPVPGTAPIAATMYHYVLLANGDLYEDSGSWAYVGNLIGLPTHSLRQTFGQLKARYR